MSDTNSVSIRGTAAVNVGTVTANTTKDVTWANVNAAVGDSAVVTPAAAGSSGVSLGESIVTAAGVITTRVANSTTANVAAGTAVAVNCVLLKATGSI